MTAITHAVTDEERQEVHALFDRTFKDIAPDGVPMANRNAMYAPIIPTIRNGSGDLIAAAMSCRAQVAAAWTMLRPGVTRGHNDYGAVLERHSELDLIAVEPSARGTGLGSQLVVHIEQILAQRGVRVWFGCATKDLEVPRLEEFYTRLGFKIVPGSQPLPEFLGKRWTLPLAEQPAFYFYKRPTA